MALKKRRKTGRYAVIRAYGTKELRPDDLKWILIICEKYEFEVSVLRNMRVLPPKHEVQVF
jgi:elongation factor P hydroxylase